MTALAKILAGGAALAALMSAAPAAAQYYPEYPGYGNPGAGYGYPGGGYGYGQQAIINQCVGAVQARLNGGYGNYGSDGYDNPYGGYGSPYGYGRARVLGISRVEPRSGGGLTVRGVANSGVNVPYGHGGEPRVDLTWRCKTDYRGFISDIDIDRAERNYGYDYQPYDNDYSQYGYRRY